MSTNNVKSFAYELDPLNLIRLTNDKYENIGTILENKKPFWMHFEQPSKTCQQQLIKKLNIPKAVRLVLFAEETRPRCLKHENTLVLIIQGIESGNPNTHFTSPSLRFWITPQFILTVSTGKIKSIEEMHNDLKSEQAPSLNLCLTYLLEYAIFHIEESAYELDEILDKIETELNISEQVIPDMLLARQTILCLRRYVLPQRDAIVMLANKIDAIYPNADSTYKEISDSMIRQVETLEMLRERAMIIQDNITNQIGELSNKRMYLLTIIMLIFTPAFFIMGLFSMYIPIPFMNDKATWWAVLGFIIALSVALYYVFKKRKWL